MPESDSVAIQEIATERRRPALPLFLVLLIGYLLFDAVMRLVQGATIITQETMTAYEKQLLFENLVVATFYLLLFLQILLRTLAARIWGTIVFVFHIVWLVIRFGVNDPEEWLALSQLGRIQILTRLLFFTVVVVMLNRNPTREALRS